MIKMKMFSVTITTIILCLSVTPLYAQESSAIHAPDTLPGVEPEMLNPDYWIALHDDADDIIMTPAEIKAFNTSVNENKMVYKDYFGKDDPLKADYISSTKHGLVMNLIDPLESNDLPTSEFVRSLLESNREQLINPDPLYGNSNYYDGRLAVYNKKMKDKIVATMNMDAVPDKIVSRLGMIVNHALVRQFPTTAPGYSNNKSMLDRFQLTDLCIGNPVRILHESTDGDFLFVECPLARGWIAATDIAFSDRDTLRGIAESKNVLMSAGHRVPVYGDPKHRTFSRHIYFSATLPLVSQNGSGFSVKLPYRKTDGSLGIDTGYLKPDADVHVGHLPYTKRNVLNQLFKLWDTPYGWHGQDHKRDCAGTMRVLLRCFGIKVGKNPAFILSAAQHQFRMNPELSRDAKMAEASKLEGVITMVGNSGHVALLLGKAGNGELYFMHQAGWGYKDADGVQNIVGRVTINRADHGFYSINTPNVFTTMRK